MKLAPALLALSLAVNLAGIALLGLRPALAPPAIRAFLGVVTPEEAAEQAAAERRASAARTATAAPPPSLWSQLHSDDLRLLVARLRAAGFSPVVIRAVVDRLVADRFDPRIKAVTRERDATPYWRQPPYLMSGSKPLEDLNQIYRERARLLRELLGTDALAYGGYDISAAQRRQYGDLSQAKIDLVARINDDYAEMTGQIRAGMQGVTLPEDREKLALLEREKRADLAAVLTPAELADYEMRASNVTSRLRTSLSIMNADEAEFRRIYAALQPFAEVLYPTVPTSGIPSEVRRDATLRANEALKAALGPERFADYQRASNSDYQQLYRLTQGETLAPGALNRVYDARTVAAAASTQVMNDRSLTPEQRTAALQAVAAQARTTVLSNLGPKAGQAYAQSASWLTYIERGGSVSITSDGYLSYRMPPTTPPPAPTAPPSR